MVTLSYSVFHSIFSYNITGKKEGLYTSWYENGQKEYEANYKDGELEGLHTYWDKDGNITKTETYKDGQLVK